MNESAYDKAVALLRVFEQHDLEELVVEEAEFRLHLRRCAGEAPSVPLPPAPAAGPAPLPSGAPQPPKSAHTVAVRAPLIGIFYRSASASTPAFVQEGDLVREGQTVCIIEAMKVFNEIRSEWEGRVVDLPVANGKLVQAGDSLVVLEMEENVLS